MQKDVEAPSYELLARRTETKNKQPTVVQRCLAQELSPGTALAWIIVLATGCVVHMPGAFLISKRGGLYRLAPELGIFEALLALNVACEGVFRYRKGLRLSVMATLIMRHFKAKEDPWWQSPECDPSSPGIHTASNCYLAAEDFLRRIQTCSLDRLLGHGLMILALIKAFAVQGAIRTNLLAASYGLSFYSLELLSLATLQFGPPKDRAELESELLKCTELILVLDESEKSWQIRYSIRWQTPQKAVSVKIFKYIVLGLYGLAASLHLVFWPVSVPLFVLFDFTFYHQGKWDFAISTFLIWAFWVAVAAAALSVLVALPGLLVWTIPEKRDSYWHGCRWLLKRLFQDVGLADAYTVLKFAVVVRMYLFTYTGEGTVKPNWVEWLG